MTKDTNKRSLIQKTMAFFIACLMVIQMVPISASAAAEDISFMLTPSKGDEANVNNEPIKVKAGDRVAITISISGTDNFETVDAGGVTSIYSTLVFDSSKVSPITKAIGLTEFKKQVFIIDGTKTSPRTGEMGLMPPDQVFKIYQPDYSGTGSPIDITTSPIDTYGSAQIVWETNDPEWVTLNNNCAASQGNIIDAFRVTFDVKSDATPGLAKFYLLGEKASNSGEYRSYLVGKSAADYFFEPSTPIEVEVEVVPEAPTLTGTLTATPRNGRVFLEWPAAEGVVDDYMLKADKGGGNAVFEYPSKDATSYEFTGLENGTEYTFSIVARNSGGESDPLTATATPQLPDVESISVDTASTSEEAKNAILDGMYDPVGLVLDVTYVASAAEDPGKFTVTEDNKDQITVTNGGPFADLGSTAITIGYGGKETIHTINVVEKTLESIEVLTSKEYREEDTYQKADLQIAATFNNGMPAVTVAGSDAGVTTDLADDTQLTIADHNDKIITVSYSYNGGTAQTATYNLVVKPKNIESIAITSQPTNKAYVEGKPFDPTGLEVTATYEGGGTGVLKPEEYDIQFDGKTITNMTPEMTALTVVLKENPAFTAEISGITVEKRVVSRIEVDESSTHNASYIEQQTFSTEGLAIKVTFNDGDTSVITSGYEYSPKEPLAIGEQNITVTYGGKEVQIPISVRAKQLTGISVTKTPRLEYGLNAKFTSEGLEVSANYDNDTTEVLPRESYTLDVEEGTVLTAEKVPFTKPVTITHTASEKTTTYDITINEKALHDLVISKAPKTTYYVGEKLDLTGMVVTANYNDDTSRELAGDEYTIAPDTETPAMDALYEETGTYTYTISYSEDTESGDTYTRTTTLTVNVINKSTGGSGGPASDYIDAPISSKEPEDDKGHVIEADKLETYKNEDGKVSVKLTEDVLTKAEKSSKDIIVKVDKDDDDRASIVIPYKWFNDDGNKMVVDTGSDLSVELLDNQFDGLNENDLELSISVASDKTIEIKGLNVSTREEVKPGNYTNVVRVTMPAELEVGQDADNMVAYIMKDGKQIILPTSGYDTEEGRMEFAASELGTFGFTYKKVEFNDVSADNWASSYVNYLAARDIVSGGGIGADGTAQFNPNGQVTRAEFLKMLEMTVHGLGIADAQEATFNDVDDGAWYKQYINWAAENKVIVGSSDDEFMPNGNITREQMCTIISRYADAIDLELEAKNSIPSFNDGSEVSSWAADSVNKLAESGIITGKDGNKFDPKGTAKRSEAATVIYRLLKSM